MMLPLPLKNDRNGFETRRSMIRSMQRGLALLFTVQDVSSTLFLDCGRHEQRLHEDLQLRREIAEGKAQALAGALCGKW